MDECGSPFVLFTLASSAKFLTGALTAFLTKTILVCETSITGLRFWSVVLIEAA